MKNVWIAAVVAWLVLVLPAGMSPAGESSPPPLRVEGYGFEVNKFAEDARAYGNRGYVWKDVPEALRGWQFTRTNGGDLARMDAVAAADGAIHIATADKQKGIDLAGWEKVDGWEFYYTDGGKTRMQVYRRLAKAAQKLPIPQGNWTGGIVLAPRIVAAPMDRKADLSLVPGVVVHHSAAMSGLYIGSPGIAVLDDGAYLAKCDLFGPKSKEHDSAITLVFRSEDKGRSWKQVARIDGLFWSNIFSHRGKAYQIGTQKHHGRLVVLRSDDGGRTWTTPTDADSGLLVDSGEYHTAPMPMLVHNGRLWRAMEDASGGKLWGLRYMPMVISAPLEADLLKRSSWTLSNALHGDVKWLDGQWGGWLEGNAVLTPEGHVVDILRVQTKAGGKAAIVHISDDGKRASFDPAKDHIDFPGGAKKFTIRYDEQTKRYWSLTNPVPPIFAQDTAGGTRNTLGLVSSADLRAWRIHCLLLHHPERSKHGFQYPDWLFDGEDLIAAIRTGYDDGLGGAHNAHDANFLTFHRFKDFRKLTMAESCVDPAKLGMKP